MRIKVIKNQKEYDEALKTLAELMETNPETNTEEFEKMEVLATLIEEYEKQTFRTNIPDPIDALEFRMQQMGLTQKDLIPYFGTKSRVSEVLNRKRPLTVNMMQALQSGLGIPAKVLLNQKKEKTQFIGFDVRNLPVDLLIKRNYISEKAAKSLDILESEWEKLTAVFNGNEALAMLSKTQYIRSNMPMNKEALIAWIAKVINKAQEENVTIEYKDNMLSAQFIKSLVKYSKDENGIHLAIEKLKEIGIVVVVEPHLPKTYLDGVAIMLPNKNPIIGLTLRHDRVDNFWFTLLHELAHILLHRNKDINIFYDDLDAPDVTNMFEKEADTLAVESIVPNDIWRKSPASIVPAKDAVINLANALGINPALVAGKMRFENKQYKFLNDMVGQGQVRKHFDIREYSNE